MGGHRGRERAERANRLAFCSRGADSSDVMERRLAKGQASYQPRHSVATQRSGVVGVYRDLRRSSLRMGEVTTSPSRVELATMVAIYPR